MIPLRLLPAALPVGLLPAAELLVNPGFESAPFPSGWSASGGTLAVAGLNGTATAVRLPYNTAAALSQTCAAAADFTFDVCFQTPGTNEAQSFRMTLLAGGQDAVELRAATNGVLEVAAADTYLPLTAIVDGATSNVPVNQTVKLRVVGRDFGTPSARYDLLWTDPYTGSSVPSFTRAALGLTAFPGPAATGSPVHGVRFQRNITAANSFIVDDLSLRDEAAPPGIAATHQLIVPPPDKVVNISGVYPHLAMTNTYQECGIGAVAPWADRLWVITYGPHSPAGSTDKLHEIAPDLSRVARPESVGGTSANRFVHAASNQLNIGPYFIDAGRNVRVLRPAGSTTGVIPGRLTATAAHLSDPARLYLFTMENGLYDVDPAGLTYITRYPDVQSTGDRMLFGYHGKGAATGQGRLVVANNGRVDNQSTPTGAAGVLANWDGTTVQQNGGAYLDPAPNPDEPSANPAAPQPAFLAGWQPVARIQHCEVTGPGGIHGNPYPATDPLWSTGFDAKSAFLRVMENRQWNLWRLPKGSYTHDGSHGWHTEWPRIRQLDPADPDSIYLMHMHGLFFDFPKSFSAANFAGLRPLAGYCKMPTDYCTFGGRIVIGKNDASRFNNALALKAQSNLWFGNLQDLANWGAPSGHGAIWLNQAVAAGEASDPFLVGGFPQRTLHLRNRGATPVTVGLETSPGTPAWTTAHSVSIPANGWVHEAAADLLDPWLRLRAATASPDLTAFLHLASPYPHGTPAAAPTDEFAPLADIRDTRSLSDGVIRVMNDAGLSLEFASSRTNADGTTAVHRYHRIGGPMRLGDLADATAESSLRSVAALTQSYVSDGGLTHTTGADAASAWVRQGSNTWRLPRLDPLYDAPFAAGWARNHREVVTERALLNLHGTFYEIPRDVSGGIRRMRPIATHGKRITDFASWRGLLVLTGVLDDAPATDKLVRNPDGTAALWLGEVDDIWRMGEPRGTGGPWLDTTVAANTPSDPYLMYGYDHKELTLSAAGATTVTVEVDFLADNSWSVYQTFTLAAGQVLTHAFPPGFHAHWVRVTSSAATTATARFTYGPAGWRDRLLDWARDHHLPTGSGRAAVAAADRDGDGLSQLAEFVLGASPLAPDPSLVRAAASGVSVPLRDLDPADLVQVTCETSTNLLDWHDHTTSAAPDPDQSGLPAGFTRHRLPLDPADGPRRFVRLRIELAGP